LRVAARLEDAEEWNEVENERKAMGADRRGSRDGGGDDRSMRRRSAAGSP
jgi:hypothetical protein